MVFEAKKKSQALDTINTLLTFSSMKHYGIIKIVCSYKKSCTSFFMHIM